MKLERNNFARQMLVLTATFVGSVATGPESSFAASKCDAVKVMHFDHTTIDVAESTPTGSYQPSAGAEVKGLPAFCRVHGTVEPVTGSRIGFDLWLPEVDWNGKLEMFGNGGYSSKVAYDSLGEQLKRGYAVLGTDTGHSGDDPDFAKDHPEAIVDWGHRAVHTSVVAAKAVVTEFYGRPASHSYFSGCSTGGHQALMEAQRYPKDFDGIIAGDPGNNRTHLNAGFLWQFVTNHRKGPDASQIIPPLKLATISNAVVNACRGHDGGLATDKFLTDPEACGFQPKDILCKAADAEDCLTQEQADALATMYGGARNPRTGQVIYYGWPKGSENSGRIEKALPGWSLYWADPVNAANPARLNFWRIWAFDDPNWDWKRFDFDTGMKTVDEKLAPSINAMSPDISEFAASGGKLIQYHGLDDPVVPPRESIDYFERVQAFEAKLKTAPVDQSADHYRLFLVPGMEHCRGGEGPNFLEMQQALETWVENGNAPAAINATKFVDDKPENGEVFSRPLCPYPSFAQFKGIGNSNEARNFRCEAGHRYTDPLIASTYAR